MKIFLEKITNSIRMALTLCLGVCVTLAMFAFFVQVYHFAEWHRWNTELGRLLDTPIYPNAEQASVEMTIRKGDELLTRSTKTITLRTKDTPVQVLTFYKNRLLGHGFNLSHDAEAPDTTKFEWTESCWPYYYVYIQTKLGADAQTYVEVRATIDRPHYQPQGCL